MYACVIACMHACVHAWSMDACIHTTCMCVFVCGVGDVGAYIFGKYSIKLLIIQT